MNSVKNLYTKLSGEKKYTKKELDQLCVNMKAVYQIYNSKKSYKERVGLINRIVPEIKEILQNQEQYQDYDLLGDLVRQWITKTTKICKENLAKMGVKSDKEVKEYMAQLIGPRYVPQKEIPKKLSSSLPSLSQSQSKSRRRSSVGSFSRRSTIKDTRNPYEP
jgi:hypothetical protein